MASWPPICSRSSHVCPGSWTACRIASLRPPRASQPQWVGGRATALGTAADPIVTALIGVTRGLGGDSIRSSDDAGDLDPLRDGGDARRRPGERGCRRALVAPGSTATGFSRHARVLLFFVALEAASCRGRPAPVTAPPGAAAAAIRAGGGAAVSRAGSTGGRVLRVLQRARSRLESGPRTARRSSSAAWQTRLTAPVRPSPTADRSCWTTSARRARERAAAPPRKAPRGVARDQRRPPIDRTGWCSFVFQETWPTSGVTGRPARGGGSSP
jgi:hypothetical protein